jgi:TetR/AcrR family transcriptional regulator, transcriptional repressor of bet genes
LPKLVDHARRRDEIALVACRAVARRGFAQATVAHIAREAGYTTGMVAHYFDSKQEIILAALRLILHRMDQRLRSRPGVAPTDLLGVLSEALPIDAQRRAECAFWAAFWGQLSANPQLKRLNSWVHREYRRLFARCLREHWPESAAWPAPLRKQVLGSITAFINGVTASAVSSPRDWPASVQIEQLSLQLALLRQWACAARTSAMRGKTAWISH